MSTTPIYSDLTPPPTLAHQLCYRGDIVDEEDGDEHTNAQELLGIAAEEHDDGLIHYDGSIYHHRNPCAPGCTIQTMSAVIFWPITYPHAGEARTDWRPAPYIWTSYLSNTGPYTLTYLNPQNGDLVTETYEYSTDRFTTEKPIPAYKTITPRGIV